MTNRLALWLGLVLLALLALSFLFGLDWHIVAGRLLLDLIHLVAIWR